MMTLTPARSPSAEIRRVASRPSTPGIRMSISTTSARSRRARSTACRSVGGLADHPRVFGGVDQDPEPGPNQGLVVGEQDPDHTLAPSTGRRALT